MSETTTMEFDNEHITARVLAHKMGLMVSEVLNQMTKEILGDIWDTPVGPGTILPWQVVRRYCETHGWKAVDVYDQPRNKLTEDEWMMVNAALLLAEEKADNRDKHKWANLFRKTLKPERP